MIWVRIFILIFILVLCGYAINLFISKRTRDFREIRVYSLELQKQMDEIEQICKTYFLLFPELTTILLDEINLFHYRTNQIGRKTEI